MCVIQCICHDIINAICSQRVNDTAQLKELISTARYARCRSRFVMPVILFNNKVSHSHVQYNVQYICHTTAQGDLQYINLYMYNNAYMYMYMYIMYMRISENHNMYAFMYGCTHSIR